MGRLSHAVSIAWLLAAAGCAGKPVPKHPAVVVAPAPNEATLPNVDVAISGSRLMYSPQSMRVPRPAVRVTVTNPTAAPLDVADLHVRLDIDRGGQHVRCEDSGVDAASASREREPAALAPGVSSTYVREVDCPLALADTYRMQVVVAFGHEGPYANGVVIKELAVTVAAPPDAQPRAVDAVPGLYAAIGSGGMVSSTAGNGRIVVALVNGRDAPIALPRMSLALRVRRVGTDIPCESEPTRLSLPESLHANAELTRQLDVPCLGLGVTGTYDVEARLLVDEAAQPIGTLRIDVTTDPSHLNRRLIPQ